MRELLLVLTLVVERRRHEKLTVNERMVDGR